MQIVQTRERVLRDPAELWFYLSNVELDSDVDRLLLREDYESLRGYEPMMYRHDYEYYLECFEARAKQRKENPPEFFMLKVAVNRDNVNEVCNRIEALPEFSGWAL